MHACTNSYNSHGYLIITVGLVSLQEPLYHSGESQSVFSSKLLDEVIKAIVSVSTLIKIFIS